MKDFIKASLTQFLELLTVIPSGWKNLNVNNIGARIVDCIEAPSKAFLMFFLLPDWLKLNHLKSRMKRGFSDIFPFHRSRTGVTNYAACFGAKNVQKTTLQKLLR